MPRRLFELADGNVAPEQFVIVCEGELLTLLCRVENTVINGNILAKGALHILELRDQIVVGDYSLLLETGEMAEKILSGEIAETPAITQVTEPQRIEPIQSGQAANILSRKYSESPLDPDKSLNDVLEGLKGEEKFYFLIENGIEEKRRVYVEAEELWIGWAASGECAISTNPADIAQARAQIRKDWSGVVLYPLKNKNVWLNKQVLDEPHRLKNDDSLQLLSKDKYFPDAKTNIKFHEPTALLVLDSILPKELPPPVSLEKTVPPDLIKELQNAENNKSVKQTKRGKRQTFRLFYADSKF